MSECRRLHADAPGLAALRADDPERVAARAHAGDCADCARALREAERLQAVLGSGAPARAHERAPSGAARAILAELRREARRRARGSMVAAGVAVLLFLGFARVHSRSAGDWAKVAALSALALLLAALARRRPLLVVGATALAALAAGLLPGGPRFADSPGVHCLATELASAALVVGAVWLAIRGGSTSPARAALAASAAAGALAGDAALQATCGAQGEVPHLLAFHVGGVLLAAAAAGLVAGAARRGAASPLPAAERSGLDE